MATIAGTVAWFLWALCALASLYALIRFQVMIAAREEAVIRQMARDRLALEMWYLRVIDDWEQYHEIPFTHRKDVLE